MSHHKGVEKHKKYYSWSFIPTAIILARFQLVFGI